MATKMTTIGYSWSPFLLSTAQKAFSLMSVPSRILSCSWDSHLKIFPASLPHHLSPFTSSPYHLITPSPPPLLSSPLSCSSPLAIGVHIYGRFDAVMWLRLCVMVIILIEVNCSEKSIRNCQFALAKVQQKMHHALAYVHFFVFSGRTFGATVYTCYFTSIPITL